MSNMAKRVVAAFTKTAEAKDPFEVGNEFKKALDTAIKLHKWDIAKKIQGRGVELGIFSPEASGRAVETAEKEMQPLERELNHFVRTVLERQPAGEESSDIGSTDDDMGVSETEEQRKLKSPTTSR